ncbi:SDR family oxidoreductase [Glaesserella sp.]|uniref:SDR family oxidoreductase n=1 Tax=Glaesserella sp. TaxID=2094731 RepID=UPI0035A1724D
MKRVAIIGLGWLGLPLAEFLIAQGWQVIGSNRNAKPLPHITSLPFVLNGEIPETLLNVDAMVINLPPGSCNKEDYVEGIKRLVSQAILQNVTQLTFVSSTSVFPQTTGVFNESSAPQAENDSAEAMIELEQWLTTLAIDCDILRLAGLIGGNRHPVYYLAGKQLLTHAEQPVNLVHRNDCIRAIFRLLQTANGQRLYHLVYPDHPKRREYYSAIAAKLGLADLHFSADNRPLVRLIEGEKICRELDFRYQTDLYQLA